MPVKAAEAKPIVKWAGGKRQLLSELLPRVPDSFEKYFEPFVGGGALYLSLWNQGRISGKVFLNDANAELINLYRVVQKSPEKVSDALFGEPFENTRERYLLNRKRFNEIRDSKKTFERAVLFLYLNRFGYNGLWRVNSRGEYNIPFGRNPDSARYAELDLLKKFSEAMSETDLSCGDFAKLLPKIGKDDFVYFDPPYHPVSRTASFTSYTAESFSFADQVRLYEMFCAADKKGAKLLLSNSVAPEVLELYDEFTIEVVSVSRNINSKSSERKGSKEVLVRNY